MRKDILIKRVKEEAKNLKKNATKEELNLLDFRNLYSDSPTKCIYGQMTGDCFYPRATQLIQKCAEKVYKSDEFDPARTRLNGELIYSGIDRKYAKYFSPIEVFIAQPENKKANNKILIDFLRGKRKDMEFVYPKKRG